MLNPFVNLKMFRLHKLINSKSTGTPAQLARKFNCCERTIRSMIEELKDCGLPVSYCKTICSYYYTEDVKIDFRMAIGEQEMSKITGGTTHVNDAEKKAKDFFHTANFLPPDFGTLTPYWPIRDH